MNLNTVFVTSTSLGSSSLVSSRHCNKGVKKEVMCSSPKLTSTTESMVKFINYAICLTEFVIRDKIQVLPQCGHGFHVAYTLKLGSNRIPLILPTVRFSLFPATTSAVGSLLQQPPAPPLHRNSRPDVYLNTHYSKSHDPYHSQTKL
ncbi:RING-H2 finger protein ATL73-like [Cajanus cajan]|uniref:RING-H2 finger protein ATL73-like n=1 Tax=Cajanus cajan TaxID=3821 RepID=UPI00098D7A58|nr:RING-H2 finger protein ATL73-like [Cajanus cajan]XP_020207253.1 RING-H2 finger protein ATL73-like [Cajanus cajan]